MRALCISLLACGTALGAEDLGLPSGLMPELHEVLIDEVNAESWARFRLLAPEIARARPEAPDYFALEADFPLLCRALALPYLTEYALSPDKIAISLSDRVVEFGTTDPDATQYFELFRLENGDCIWEAL